MTHQAELDLAQIMFKNKNWEALAFLLNCWCARYIEGEIEAAKNAFNHYWQFLPKEAKQFVVDGMVFELTANDLAEKNQLTLPYERIEEFKWKYVGSGKDPRNFS